MSALCTCKAVALSLPGFSASTTSCLRDSYITGSKKARSWNLTGLGGDRIRKESWGQNQQVPAQNVLNDVSVEEEGAELVLQEAESHQAANVSERIQPHLGWPSLRVRHIVNINQTKSTTSVAPVLGCRSPSCQADRTGGRSLDLATPPPRHYIDIIIL